jgi:hypothetical protein
MHRMHYMTSHNPKVEQAVKEISQIVNLTNDDKLTQAWAAVIVELKRLYVRLNSLGNEVIRAKEKMNEFRNRVEELENKDADQ